MSKKIEEQMTESRRELKNQMEKNMKNIKQQISEVNEKWIQTSQEIQQAKEGHQHTNK